MSTEKQGSRFTNFKNFLATDKVPDTIFGIPVAKAKGEWTDEDIIFFQEHPEAGGYYSLGNEDRVKEPATQASKGGNSRPAYPGSWNNPGNLEVGENVYKGQNGRIRAKSGRVFRTFDTAQNGLNAMGASIGQMVRSKIPERFRKGKLPDDKFNINNLITIYAPPTDENNTTEYIKFVSNRMGKDSKDELSLTNKVDMIKLLDAMIRRDSGHKNAEWYTPSEYTNAVDQMTKEVE